MILFRDFSMCNAYKIGKQGVVSKREVDEIVSAAVDLLPGELVRRTGRGVVVRGIEGELSASVMRWGFVHPQHREVNNTRKESLKSPFWRESLEHRRCIVPMSEFYEWEELPEGAPKGLGKQCHAFRRPDREWLWVAGIWQEFEGVGECYSTITTPPAPPVFPIHDRMLAVLPWDRALAFLAGEDMPWMPYDGPLEERPVPSPLKRQKPPDVIPPPPPQGELF